MCHPDQLGGSPLNSLQCIGVFLAPGNVKVDTALQMWSHKCCIDRNYSFDLLATLLAKAVKDAVGLLWCQGTLLSLASLLPTGTPRSFFCKAASQSSPNRYCCMVVFHPKCKNVHLLLLNFVRVFSNHFSRTL